MTTELARIETITPTDLFKPGTLDPILDAIEAEVRREASLLDISTPENRKALASLAFKIAKSKTFVDGQGKNLVAGEKERLKVIDRERGRVWDRFESLQSEVRKPLTDWENAEKERVAMHEANLQEIIGAGPYSLQQWQYLPLQALRDRLKEITDSKYDWQEFHARAVAAVVKTIGQIKEAIAKRENWDAEQEELTRLRAEQAQREQQEREAAIAREAREAAEAEAKRRAEAAAREAEAERSRIDAERFAAEARAKEAEARATRAAEQAERQKAAAIESERRRVAEAQQKETEAAEARERNRAHAAKINREIRDALANTASLTTEQAESVVKAIASNSIPHTKISY